MKQACVKMEAWLSRHRILSGGALAAGLAALTALYNVNLGPLSNLNDIGGWRNRLLFILLCAAAQAGLGALLAFLHRGRFARLALREGILTVGFLILTMAMNHKSYAYVQVLQPVVRAMDAGGLAAGLPMECGLSAPAKTLLYLVTRGPVYDMYLVKLCAIVSLGVLALLVLYGADALGMGIRAEVAFLFALILPQGFLTAAFTGTFELIAAMLLTVSLVLLMKRRATGGAIAYALAVSLSGAALYALPFAVYALYGREKKPLALALMLGLPIVCCFPAAFFGMHPADAVGSILQGALGLPAYASGAPGFMGSVIPRPLVSEIPEMFMLRHVAEMDLVTNAQPYYTVEHFEIVSRGLAIAMLAIWGCLLALVWQDKKHDRMHKAFILLLAALLLCPGAGAGMWLPLGMLCVLLVLRGPSLRLPCCLVLFAAAGAAAYPAVEETLLPMVYAFALCLAALLMALDVIPMNGNGRKNNG